MMNRLYYNTIHNPCDKKKSLKNIYSNISNEYPMLMSQMLPPMNNNPVLFKNPFFGSGDYSNIMHTMPLSTVNTILSNKIERLPSVRPPSNNDGRDGYRIYSRSTMVEIAWQYDLKQWKEILGQNPHNNFGILLTLQKEKKSIIDNCVGESIDSGYSNDFHDNSSYSNYLTQSNDYLTNNRKIGDGKSLTSHSPSISFYSSNSPYTPFKLNHDDSFKNNNNKVTTTKSHDYYKPQIYTSNYGSQNSITISNTTKSPQNKNIWESAYNNLLQKDFDNSEANIYTMFLDKLNKKISNKLPYDSNNKKKNYSQYNIVNLSDIEKKEQTYTREEMLMISKKYTSDEWKNYLIENFSNNNVVMNHLKKDIFIVDSNPMRPKMSKEVKAIFKKFKIKKKCNEKKKKEEGEIC